MKEEHRDIIDMTLNFKSKWLSKESRILIGHCQISDIIHINVLNLISHWRVGLTFLVDSNIHLLPHILGIDPVTKS